MTIEAPSSQTVPDVLDTIGPFTSVLGHHSLGSGGEEKKRDV